MEEALAKVLSSSGGCAAANGLDDGCGRVRRFERPDRAPA